MLLIFAKILQNPHPVHNEAHLELDNVAEGPKKIEKSPGVNPKHQVS